MSSAAQEEFAKYSSRTQRNARTLRAYMALRNQEIAQRIKDLREERGNPPQPVVAAAVGVSLRTYQNWEGGDAKPEYRNLEHLAKYFGVSEEFILTGTENSRPESPVVVSGQIDAMADEFRGHVSEMLNLLREAREERHRIEKLLATQQKILERMEAVAAGLPSDENLHALNVAAQQLMEIAEADATPHAEPSSTQAGTGRRQATGR